MRLWLKPSMERDPSPSRPRAPNFDFHMFSGSNVTLCFVRKNFRYQMVMKMSSFALLKPCVHVPINASFLLLPLLPLLPFDFFTLELPAILLSVLPRRSFELFDGTE